MAKKVDSETANKDFLKLLESKYNAYFEPETIRTGIVPLDLVLNGGLETGSLIELSSASQAGKSTLVLHLAKNLAEKGYKTLYIDSEGSVKDDMIDGIGLSEYRSTRSNPDNYFTVVRESGYTAVEELINEALKTERYKLFVIDSLTALASDEYLDVNSGRDAVENRIGLDALMTSRLLKKLNAVKTDYNCIFIVINQTRLQMNGYVSSYQSTGGKSVEYYPDVRLFIKVKEKIKDKKQIITGEIETPIGANVTIEAKKSRLGLGFIPYPMTIYYGKGISNLLAYENLLQSIKIDKKTTMLEKLSNVSYVLHLSTGDVKTTKGANGLHQLIVDNIDEVIKEVDEYLDEYFTKIKNGEVETISDEYTEEVVDNALTEDIDIPEDMSFED